MTGMHDTIGFNSLPTFDMMSCFNFGSCRVQFRISKLLNYSMAWHLLVFVRRSFRAAQDRHRHTTGVKQETKQSKPNQLVAIASQNPPSRVHPDDCSLYCQASTDLRNVCVYTIQHDYQPKPFLLSHLPYVGFVVSGTMNFGKL